MLEHDVQTQIIGALQFLPGAFWRVNVACGFQGNYRKNRNGSITIQNPRFVRTGVPKGFPDLIGIKPVTITPEMVGKTFGQFCFIEVKSEIGFLSQDQELMHSLLTTNGAKGGTARSVEDALNLLK